eukprot:3024355-Rhodomonas_salina.1
MAFSFTRVFGVVEGKIQQAGSGGGERRGGLVLLPLVRHNEADPYGHNLHVSYGPMDSVPSFVPRNFKRRFANHSYKCLYQRPYCFEICKSALVHEDCSTRVRYPGPGTPVRASGLLQIAPSQRIGVSLLRTLPGNILSSAMKKALGQGALLFVLSRFSRVPGRNSQEIRVGIPWNSYPGTTPTRVLVGIPTRVGIPDCAALWPVPVRSLGIPRPVRSFLPPHFELSCSITSLRRNPTSVPGYSDTTTTSSATSCRHLPGYNHSSWLSEHENKNASLHTESQHLLFTVITPGFHDPDESTTSRRLQILEQGGRIRLAALASKTDAFPMVPLSASVPGPRVPRVPGLAEPYLGTRVHWMLGYAGIHAPFHTEYRVSGNSTNNSVCPLPGRSPDLRIRECKTAIPNY